MQRYFSKKAEIFQKRQGFFKIPKKLRFSKKEDIFQKRRDFSKKWTDHVNVSEYMRQACCLQGPVVVLAPSGGRGLRFVSKKTGFSVQTFLPGVLFGVNAYRSVHHCVTKLQNNQFSCNFCILGPFLAESAYRLFAHCFPKRKTSDLCATFAFWDLFCRKRLQPFKIIVLPRHVGVLPRQSKMKSVSACCKKGSQNESCNGKRSFFGLAMSILTPRKRWRENQRFFDGVALKMNDFHFWDSGKGAP